MKTVRLFRSALSGALLLGALMLSGCSQDEPAGQYEDGPVAVSFTAGIQATRTTTGGDAWLATDRVGVFMLAAGGSPTTPADVLADNEQYNVSDASTGALSPASGTPLYYPQTGNVDFAAYYPYTGTTGTGAGQITTEYLYNITVAGQSTEAAQNALDVLYAKTTNVAKSKTAPVVLTFGHVLSKVTLDVTLGDGLTSLTGDKITAATFSGMPQTATMALQDGTLTAGQAGDFPALKAATANAQAAATFTALLVPQTTNAYTGRTMVFTVAGETYTGTIPDADAFEKGNHYTYPVTVKLTGVTVGKPAITDWEVDDTHDTGTAAEIGAGIAKVKIPAGTFQMGSPDGEDQAYPDEQPQHWVRLTKDFYMSKYLITNAQYAAFLNANSIGGDGKGLVSYNKDGGTVNNEEQTFVYDCTTGGRDQWGLKWDADKWVPITGYESHPVIYVTWYSAKAFADWIGGSLPTEAQWEYACRAGTTTIYSYGDEADGDYMWYWVNNTTNGETNGTKAVGRKLANPWGLYDMHGNVFEWCLDQWDGSSNYPAAATESDAVTDPLVTTGSYRVLRGGFWGYSARFCRSAYRDFASPGIANSFVGFRMAFAP